MSNICRGIKNPIGVKCGPSLAADDLLRLIDRPQSRQRAGPPDAYLPLRLRQGRDTSPKLIRAVKRKGASVVWSCDPMHGNTITSHAGYKTRPFDRILSEVKSAFFDRAPAEGTHAGGSPPGDDRPERDRMHRRRAAHLREDLVHRYHTHCDPRLNADQALELAFLIAELLKQEAPARPADAGRRGALIDRGCGLRSAAQRPRFRDPFGAGHTRREVVALALSLLWRGCAAPPRAASNWSLPCWY